MRLPSLVGLPLAVGSNIAAVDALFWVWSDCLWQSDQTSPRWMRFFGFGRTAFGSRIKHRRGVPNEIRDLEFQRS